jgi:hypothetical protein
VDLPGQQFNKTGKQAFFSLISSKLFYMKRIITAILLITLLTTGCTKKADSVTAKDNNAPIVRILGPSAIQHFKTGDPLCVTATAFDEGVLSRVSVKILKDGLGTVMYQQDFTVNDVTFQLYHKIIVPSGISGNCSLVVEATDTFGNKGAVAIGFSAN